MCKQQPPLILMQQIVYSIEGNIGSGKTVLLHLLSKRLPNILIAPEPLGEWQQIENHNLLKVYYDDPHRWAYTFQNYALLTRSNHLHNLIKNNYSRHHHLFSERSIVADKQIFAKLLAKQGKLNDMEHKLYLRFYQDLNQLYKLPILHRHIYLRTDPQCCLERIKKRGRPEQVKIELGYLKALHEMHQEWLGGGKALLLNGTLEFQTDEKQLAAMLKQIGQWLSGDKL